MNRLCKNAGFLIMNNLGHIEPPFRTGEPPWNKLLADGEYSVLAKPPVQYFGNHDSGNRKLP
jgi:hypothetical protein